MARLDDLTRGTASSCSKIAANLREPTKGREDDPEVVDSHYTRLSKVIPEEGRPSDPEAFDAEAVTTKMRRGR